MIAMGEVAMLVAATLSGSMILLTGRRRALGGTLLLSFPLGMVGLAFAALVTTIFDLTWTPWLIIALLAGYTLLAVTTAVLARRSGDIRQERSTKESQQTRISVIDIACIAAYVGTIAALAYLFRYAGVSLFTADSWAGYYDLGILLRDTGQITPTTISFRGILIPALVAGTDAFGGEWLLAVFPTVSLSILGLLAWMIVGSDYNRDAHLPERRTRVVVAVIALVALVTTAPYLAHSVYFHSHMVSALYLLSMFVCFREAGWVSDEAGASWWTALAGIAALGFTFVRPDGLAYVFVGHIAVVAMLFDGRLSRRSVAWYFGVLSIGTLAAHAAIMSVYGAYDVSLDRLSALDSLYVALATPVFGVFALGVYRIRTLRRTLNAGWVLLLSLTGLLVVYGSVWLLSPEDAALAWEINWTNLLSTGGYNSLWVFACVVAVIGTAMWFFSIDTEWLPILLTSVLTFILIAFIIHGATHPGRIGWSDSFNRVVFHVVPLVFWLAAWEGVVLLGEVYRQKVTAGES